MQGRTVTPAPDVRDSVSTVEVWQRRRCSGTAPRPYRRANPTPTPMNSTSSSELKRPLRALQSGDHAGQTDFGRPGRPWRRSPSMLRLAVLAIGAGLAAAAVPIPTVAGVVTPAGRHLMKDGVRFVVRGMNYYPRDHTWSRFWPQYWSAKDQIATELDIAQSLGVNTVRFFLPYRHFNSSPANAAYLGALQDFLGELQARSMLALPTLFDFYPSDSPIPYQGGDYPACQDHISAVVGAVGVGNPVVVAWDIKNEPDRDYFLGKPMVQSWLANMSAYLHAVAPGHLVTIGFYGADAGGTTFVPTVPWEMSSVVDIVSFHYFLPEYNYPTGIQAVRSLIGEKPMLLEEFGLHTLTSGVSDPHTEVQQAAYYNALLSVSEA